MNIKRDTANQGLQSSDQSQKAQPLHFNRPGKPAISYRLKTHSGFLSSMRKRLHIQEVALGQETISPDSLGLGEKETVQPLRSLNALSNESPAVALLDAWAMMADVLTFYQERLANEGFISTATEKKSVIHLARTVGYELHPGVAASTSVAFTVEDAKGAPQTVEIPAGTRIDSIPEPGKLPIAFETKEPLVARADWNSLLPERMECQRAGDGITELLVQGASNQLHPGDVIIFIGRQRKIDQESHSWQMRVLDLAEQNFEKMTTRIAWKEPLQHLGLPDDINRSGLEIFVLREKNLSLFGHNAPDDRSYPDREKRNNEGERWSKRWPSSESEKIKGRYPLDLDGLYPHILNGSWIVLLDPIFEPRLCQVSEANTFNRSAYSLIAKVTRVLPDIEFDQFSLDLRETIILAQSESLHLASVERTVPPLGTEIELCRPVFGLKGGKALVVSGKRMRARIQREGLNFYPEALKRTLQPGNVLKVISPPKSNKEDEWIMMDEEGYAGTLRLKKGDIQLLPSLEEDETVSENALLLSVSLDPKRTALILSEPLFNFYDPQTMEVFANVVSATHGETVEEILGSGDGTRINQSFVLKRPLTFTSAQNATGAASTLQIRVDGILWEEAPSFMNLNPSSRAYILRIDDNGKARITFGDGKRGARLPTGTENVIAVYRSGLGPEGNAPAASLSLLPKRPPGIRSVANPQAASGGASQERISTAKRNAPKPLMTLDRMVSIRDFERFASTFAGIGKAKAEEVMTEQGKAVIITVSGLDGLQLKSESDIIQNLQAAIRRRCRPVDRFQIVSYKRLNFRVEAFLVIDYHYEVQSVKRQAEAALRDAFSFSRRSFAQDVAASEIIACLQGIKGVVYVRMEALSRSDRPGLEIKTQLAGFGDEVRPKSLSERQTPINLSLSKAAISYSQQQDSHKEPDQKIRAKPAQRINDRIEPAELLLMDPSPGGVVLNIEGWIA